MTHQPESNEDWKKEFDELFEVQKYTFDDDTQEENRCDNDNADEIKEFIEKLLEEKDLALSEARKEIDELEACNRALTHNHGVVVDSLRSSLKQVKELHGKLVEALKLAQEALENPFEPTTMPHKKQVEYEAYCEDLQVRAINLVKEILAHLKETT